MGEPSGMADEISNAIKTAATNPKSAESDGVKVTAHSLRDQIEADRYVRATEATRKRVIPIRRSNIASGPPGGA